MRNLGITIGAIAVLAAMAWLGLARRERAPAPRPHPSTAEAQPPPQGGAASRSPIEHPEAPGKTARPATGRSADGPRTLAERMTELSDLAQRARAAALREVQAAIRTRGRMGAVKFIEERVTADAPSTEESARRIFIARLFPFAAGDDPTTRQAACQAARDLLSRLRDEDLRIQLIAGLAGLHSTGWSGSADSDEAEPVLTFLLEDDLGKSDPESPFGQSLADTARDDPLLLLLLRNSLATDGSWRIRRAAALGMAKADPGEDARRSLIEAALTSPHYLVSEAAIKGLVFRDGGPATADVLVRAVAERPDAAQAKTALELLAQVAPYTPDLDRLFTEFARGGPSAPPREHLAASAFRFLAGNPKNPLVGAFLQKLLALAGEDAAVLAVYADQAVEQDLQAFVPSLQELEARFPEGSQHREALSWATRRMTNPDFLRARSRLREAQQRRHALDREFKDATLSTSRRGQVAQEINALSAEIGELERRLADF